LSLFIFGKPPIIIILFPIVANAAEETSGNAPLNLILDQSYVLTLKENN